MSFFKVEHISSGYGKKPVLFDISLELEPGETLLLIGSNGSGKSTMLKTIYGLLKPWGKEGRIWFKGEDITGCKPAQLIRRGLVYIPQQNELFEDLTVLENIEIAGMQTIRRQELPDRTAEVLDRLPVLKDLTKRECSRLSGGERKQVSLAMALINRPDLILIDEPLAGVSPKNIEIIVERLKNLKKSGISVILVEHRVKNVFELADKVVGLKLGRVFSKQLHSIEQTNEVIL